MLGRFGETSRIKASGETFRAFRCSSGERAVRGEPIRPAAQHAKRGPWRRFSIRCHSTERQAGECRSTIRRWVSEVGGSVIPFQCPLESVRWQADLARVLKPCRCSPGGPEPTESPLVVGARQTPRDERFRIAVERTREAGFSPTVDRLFAGPSRPDRPSPR